MNKQDMMRAIVFHGALPEGWKRHEGMRMYRNSRGEQLTDKEVYEYRRGYVCAVCGHGPDSDMRHLTIECFYAVDEVSSKFTKEDHGYSLRLCKGCRARFLFHHLARFIDEGGRLAEPNLDASGNVVLVVEPI